MKIVGHRDTKGEPEDPNLNYCTVRFAELEAQGVGSEGEMELPESELLRRCPKLLRQYRRGVGAAADAAACVEGCRPPHFNLYFIIVTYMIIIIKAI